MCSTVLILSASFLFLQALYNRLVPKSKGKRTFSDIQLGRLKVRTYQPGSAAVGVEEGELLAFFPLAPVLACPLPDFFVDLTMVFPPNNIC